MIPGKVFKQNPDGTFSEDTETESLLDAHDPDACQHPNIVFEDDQYNEQGERVSKHHWWCPDCNFLQVG